MEFIQIGIALVGMIRRILRCMFVNEAHHEEEGNIKSIAEFINYMLVNCALR